MTRWGRGLDRLQVYRYWDTRQGRVVIVGTMPRSRTKDEGKRRNLTWTQRELDRQHRKKIIDRIFNE